MQTSNAGSRTGFTLLEVLIALFILSLAITADFGLVASADRAAAGGKAAACAGILAANEAERIKGAAAYGDTLGDTTYADTVEGMSFEVRRTVARNDTAGLQGAGIQELEILVASKPADKTLARCRVLQGREGL